MTCCWLDSMLEHCRLVGTMLALTQVAQFTGCQATFSSFKLFLTNRTVQRPKSALQTYGSPHPTPNATRSFSDTIKTVVTIAIVMRLIPQNHVSRNSMRRNRGPASYLFITASRCASSPRASIAPVSSSIASNAGLHRAPFGVEDIWKGNR